MSLLVILLLAARSPSPAATLEPPDLVLVLGYMASDYAAAVADDGSILDEHEYREMQGFASRAQVALRGLNLGPAGAVLMEAVEGRRPPDAVLSICLGLVAEIEERFDLARFPEAIPDFSMARRIYHQQCLSCHGDNGRGDGPQGAALTPPPRDFTTGMELRSASQLFAAIERGIPGTGMASFSHLSPAEIWDLAFLALRFAHLEPGVGDAVEVGQGVRVLKGSLSDLDLREVSRLSDQALLDSLLDRGLTEEEADHWRTLIRREPSLLPLTADQKRSPLATAIALLRRAEHRLAMADLHTAERLVLRSYLEGFEPAEGELMTRPGADVVGLEKRYDTLQRQLATTRSEAAQAAVAIEFHSLTDELQRLARPTEPSTPWVFVQSGVILFREGLEAVLLVLLLLGASEVGASRRAAQAALVGTVLAIGLGVLLWLGSLSLVAVGGIRSLWIELASTWLAVFVLGYLVLWQGARGGDHALAALRHSVSSSAARGAVGTVGFLAFLAVFRESLEVVIFYSSLWSQAASQHLVVGLGALVGLSTLALLFLAVRMLEARMPYRRLFVLTNWGLLLVLLILVGQGMQKLQQAGWLDMHFQAGAPHVPAIGLFPTWESIAAQVAIALTFAGLILRRRKRS